MFRPLYHFTLNKYGFEESEVNKPWYQQSLPQPVMENQKAKIYWDIHHYVTNCPSNNANKPDIAIFGKENNKWIIIEGTVCNIGKIQERELYKQAKYKELRAEIKRLYKVSEILQSIGNFTNQCCVRLPGRLQQNFRGEPKTLLAENKRRRK